ncbi:hypothetical protein HQ590_05585 [bacterium]|nr:hypothetical protein [bacterium]
MNDRERFTNYVRFRQVDRPPRWEWSFRADTTELWYQQGLPSRVPAEVNWANYFGLDRGSPFVSDSAPTALGVDFGPQPGFANGVVEEAGPYIVRKNYWGATCRELKAADHHSIPQYLSFAVRSREDFQEYKKRLDPTDPTRYPADWEKRKAAWANRDYPLRLHTYGWYGLLRELLGFEELSLAFFDQPDLIEEISEFWADFTLQVFARALAEVTPDFVLFWEDLAFKTGPLLSPDQFRRFLLPHYQRVIKQFRRHGIDTFMVDSDGNLDLISPFWLEAGINMLGPYEVAAGMDVVQVGKTYRDLVLVGGLDKREIAKGRAALEAEVLRRVPPLLERGGYIPTLDHATIPELSLDDYRYYREFLQKLCEG